MSWSFQASTLKGIKTLRMLIAYLSDQLFRLFQAARYYEPVANLTYGTNVQPGGNRSGVQRIEVTDSVAFTVLNPTLPKEGVRLTLDFINSADGTIGTVTFGSEYKLDGAFTKPKIDNHCVYTFYRAKDKVWRETSRSKSALPLVNPTAGFTQIKTGLSVAFTDTSVAVSPATLTSWSWNFGDSGTSTSQNPTHVFGADGTYTVTLTVGDSNGSTDDFTRNIKVSAAATGTGIPFGPFDLLLDDTHLRPNAGSFNASLDDVSSGAIVTRINFANSVGVGLVLAMTGGARANYLTNGVFSRIRWSARQQGFNTAAIISAVQTGVTDGSVLSASVMDEPGNDGGPGNAANSWGPTGTMSKAGSTPQQLWGITVGAAALATATTITLSTGLAKAIPSGTLLTFTPGSNKSATLSQNAAAGDTTLHVSALPHALAFGDSSYSNAVDNMCQEVKNIFGPTLPVGCFMDYSVFPTQSFAICDFIISQYRWNKSKGDVSGYITKALALGTRDGHQIAFGHNVLDGGIPVGPASGCSSSTYWVCGTNTGGLGSYCPNCAMTPTQVEDFGKALGDAGCGVIMWKYRDAFFANAANKTAFANIASHLATLPTVSWLRP